ncbi:DUF4347 domain-containing protein [Spirosoma pollinicola]|uniref:DUF4347 domain-containing protein n=1 Tax=Spirosoma pollinicola TaxID=2057025 RepID=A0A2K8YTY2_9BACT|nr:DUF4347 domain-containing protein [Spirosoma pollinicola]AUD01092.1 hypothetical protein CWM47_04185 [Spirosoma pollinicola]
MAMVHLYDNTPSTRFGIDNSVASGANARSEDRIKKPVINVNEMRQALDDLLRTNTSVEQLLIETHGGPGKIGIGVDVIDHTFVNSWFGDRGYERLFASSARILFNGCNVAEGANGWRFLEAFGTVFLKLNGGQVTGWTSGGSSNPFNGHVVHLWGDVRSVFFAPGGTILERFEQ